MNTPTSPLSPFSPTTPMSPASPNDPEAHRLMVYQANLKVRFSNLDKQLDSLKNNFVKVDNLAKETQHRNLGLASNYGLMELGEHKELQLAVTGIIQTLHDVNIQTGYLGERVGSVCAIDLERFQAKLKSLRSFVHGHRKENKKGMKKDVGNVYQYRSENDRARIIRESKKLEERIYAELTDLKSIIDEYIHAQLMYHSRCFEAWAKLYSKCKQNSKALAVIRDEDSGSQKTETNKTDTNKRHTLPSSMKIKQVVVNDEDDSSEESSAPIPTKTSISASSIPNKSKPNLSVSASQRNNKKSVTIAGKRN